MQIFYRFAICNLQIFYRFAILVEEEVTEPILAVVEFAELGL